MFTLPHFALHCIALHPTIFTCYTTPRDNPLPQIAPSEPYRIYAQITLSIDLSCIQGISFWSPLQGGISRLVPGIQMNLPHFTLTISRAKAMHMASHQVLYICLFETLTFGTPAYFGILVKRSEPIFQLWKKKSHRPLLPLIYTAHLTSHYAPTCCPHN